MEIRKLGGFNIRSKVLKTGKKKRMKRIERLSLEPNSHQNKRKVEISEDTNFEIVYHLKLYFIKWVRLSGKREEDSINLTKGPVIN